MRSLCWAAALLLLACTPSGEDSGDDEGGADSEGEGPSVPRHSVAGVAVDWVEANQGIGVRIGQAQGAVAPEDRSGYLVRHRNTLFRAGWRTDGTVAREILAVLRVRKPEGGVVEFESVADVSLESRPNTLEETFYWGVPAEHMVPGVSYDIELFEADAAAAVPGVARNVFPQSGSLAVGVESSAMTMSVVIVPFHYDDGAGCITEPDLSPTTLALFHDLLYMMNPVQQVSIALHAPVSWPARLEGFGALNAHLSELRAEEDAAPEVFYYGLVDVCSNGLGGAGGQAFGIPSLPPAREQAYQRVSSGLSLLDNPQWSAETFVHELGHSLGRRHVGCNGTEGGVDPSYPVDGGAVGEWGFGILDFALRHPTVHKDYMTYCHPTWVSTWGWNKVYPALRVMSEWAASGAPATEGALLLGTVMPSGAEHWHTVPGTLQGVATRGSMMFAFDRGGGEEEWAHGFELELPDDDGSRLLAVPLPERFEEIERVARREASGDLAIPRAAIRELHRRGSLRARP